jgi:SAM-dependent methyltransferase
LIAENEIKQQVREFYDSIGWRQIGEGVYQNARYEDLRPVCREYIHRCHLRVARFLPRKGKYLLDAGSGPIQYPEYLEYSRGFKYRVCLDISVLALREARERIGDKGLYVVGDIAHLPFKDNTFEGVVSLHTIHHLPADEHERAFEDLFRVLQLDGLAAVVYTWGEYSPMMRLLRMPMAWMNGLVAGWKRRVSGGDNEPLPVHHPTPDAVDLIQKAGTFTYKHDYRWVKRHLQFLPGLDIRVWRSVSTAFLRAFIYRRALGRFWLRLLYRFEELAPHFWGRIGQYPLIIFRKPARKDSPVERSK